VWWGEGKRKRGGMSEGKGESNSLKGGKINRRREEWVRQGEGEKGETVKRETSNLTGKGKEGGQEKLGLGGKQRLSIVCKEKKKGERKKGEGGGGGLRKGQILNHPAKKLLKKEMGAKK